MLRNILGIVVGLVLGSVVNMAFVTVSASVIAPPPTRAAGMQARIARAEAVVQQLGNHPTGGGKVCLLPEGVFHPGETAPEQVVCPYQMETRYEVAKRDLDKLKGEFAAFQDLARRRGIPL